MKKNKYLKIGFGLILLFLSSLSCSLIRGKVQSTQASPVSVSSLTPVNSTNINPNLPLATPTAGKMTNVYFGGISFIYDNVLVKGVNATIIPVKESATEERLFSVTPKMDQFEFQGYLLNKSYQIGQISVFSTQEYEALVGDRISQEINSLKKLLSLHPTDFFGTLPFLPMVMAAQAFHSQFKYIKFQNGEGVRFVTQFTSDVSPITNDRIFYTFQGITSDGAYYISAGFPVNNGILAANYDDFIKTQDPNKFFENYHSHITDTQEKLNQQPDDSFNPNLGLLDTMISSLKIDK